MLLSLAQVSITSGVCTGQHLAKLFCRSLQPSIFESSFEINFSQNNDSEDSERRVGQFLKQTDFSQMLIYK